MSTEPLHPRLTFPKSHRLRTRRDFDAVYRSGKGQIFGSLRVVAHPNGLPHCRLGLNVSRRVGNAVVRNRIKRMVREAFRLSQHDLPGGYDLLVIARKHAPAKLEDYTRWLTAAGEQLGKRWRGTPSP